MAVAGPRIQRLEWRAPGLACGGRECRRAFGSARRSQGRGRVSRGIRGPSGISMRHQARALIVSLQFLWFSYLTPLPESQHVINIVGWGGRGKGKHTLCIKKHLSNPLCSSLHIPIRFAHPPPPKHSSTALCSITQFSSAIRPISALRSLYPSSTSSNFSWSVWCSDWISWRGRYVLHRSAKRPSG